MGASIPLHNLYQRNFRFFCDRAVHKVLKLHRCRANVAFEAFIRIITPQYNDNLAYFAFVRVHFVSMLVISMNNNPMSTRAAHLQSSDFIYLFSWVFFFFFLLFSWHGSSDTFTKETFLLSFAEYSRAKSARCCATLSQERAMSDNSHSTGSSGSSTNSWTLLSPEVKTHNQISKLSFLLLYPGLAM